MCDVRIIRMLNNEAEWFGVFKPDEMLSLLEQLEIEYSGST